MYIAIQYSDPSHGDHSYCGSTSTHNCFIHQTDADPWIPLSSKGNPPTKSPTDKPLTLYPTLDPSQAPPKARTPAAIPKLSPNPSSTPTAKPPPPARKTPVHEDLEHIEVMTEHDLNNVIATAINAEETFPADTPVKEMIGKYGLMHPQTYSLQHDAIPILNGYANDGCPVDCGDNWSKERMVEAMLRGPHQSAYLPGAAEFLQKETAEKVQNGYARVVKWKHIKDNLPELLKISPVAMVPHKSKLFRVIMDLSFQFAKADGSKWESVNSATDKQAPQQAMGQLGSALKRIIALMADNCDPDRPFKLTKLDIKDGFWRMAVNDDAAWNFCYVLPSTNPDIELDEIELVVPNSLQMGWCESPPFFCAGSETARDVIEELLNNDPASLPPHPLEDLMRPDESDDMSISDSSVESAEKASSRAADDEDSDMDISDDETDDGHNDLVLVEILDDATMVEVFVDDFMVLTNNIDPANLRIVSRAMLHGIHSVFPPPEVTGHKGGDSVSVKKIKNGEGHWEFTKEFLGWLIDGKKFTITLPDSKQEKILLQIKDALKHPSMKLNDFQTLAGRLQHASFAMPAGWGLFSPISMAMAGSPKKIFIRGILKETLKDWRTVIKQLGKIPTHVMQLVATYPDFLGYSDACGTGVGGVWMGITEDIGYIVWRMEWPQDIIDELCTSSNPKGRLTMNDLELAGVVLEWLVLECLIPDLIFKSIGINCDNSTAVTWITKMRTSKSMVAARLLRLLSMRLHRRRTAPLLTIGIAGLDNDMADISSRSFKKGYALKTNQSLTSHFNKKFPLPQNKSWREFLIPSDISSRVISCVRGEPSTLGSLLRLKQIDKNTGNTGAHMLTSAARIRSLRKQANWKPTSSSLALLRGSGQVTTDTEIKSKFTQSLMRSRPSPRPLSWLDNPAPSTKTTTCTTSQSKDAWKA